jgi:hypothetical protein
MVRASAGCCSIPNAYLLRTEDTWPPLCRLLLHDRGAAAPLRLILEGLRLHDAPLAPPPYIRSHISGLETAAHASQLSTAKGQGGSPNRRQ